LEKDKKLKPMKAPLSLFLSLIWIQLFHFPSAKAQVSPETYDRAAFFLTGNLEKQIYHLEVIPTWSEDESKAFVHSYLYRCRQEILTSPMWQTGQTSGGI
jgi:hypothetical protein